MHPVFASLPTSIFEQMSALARAHDAVNLGQGFPDFGWPPELLDAAARAVCEGWNQYPPMRGVPELRSAVATHYRETQGLEVTADHVVVTSGATEALAASLMALVEPGDEVVLFEPLYDAYLPLVRRAGGIPRFVSLEPPGWRITRENLSAALGPRTRLILFNNPQNPTGRVFDSDELALVAKAAISHGALVLSDEVWEHLVFDDRRHRPLPGLTGMAERTIKIGSAGKIFSLTGWKVGWIVGAPPLVETIARAHQFITFATPPNLQSAVAFGLSRPLDPVRETMVAFARARDRLAAGVADAGFVPLAAEGTYFLCVDLAASGIAARDVEFCDRAVREAGVAAIPVSAFCESAPVETVVRLCFAKKDVTLDAGIERLARARALFA